MLPESAGDGDSKASAILESERVKGNSAQPDYSSNTGFFQIGTVCLMRFRYSRLISKDSALWAVWIRMMIDGSPAGTKPRR